MRHWVHIEKLNARLADVGDNINNAAHPIRWIRNYRGDVSRDLEVGADVLWDLGQGTPGGENPEVGVLAARPEPSSTFRFVNFLFGYDAPGRLHQSRRLWRG